MEKEISYVVVSVIVDKVTIMRFLMFPGLPSLQTLYKNQLMGKQFITKNV